MLWKPVLQALFLGQIKNPNRPFLTFQERFLFLTLEFT
ncbi:hypothetical protein LEP1GSC008_0689 [Leptospira kirschneri serovar Bulgarica str. Nikolaevo]|uniref:Uncharacterized protein n=1 Tax=Leptospira kirschneri serovar Bulgarica str. Nikolaevo TaxID=1240687 RepID=M6FA64_9LEPT|nr:hypothetical protein LEP1GSC008_0689 [Leptospira kirschneri serovar Bulgarica str. Nikolaevo]